MTYSIVAEGLTKRYGETVALAGVDLAARTGSVLGLLGPNGAGKTTAVRVLATLVRPDSGRATVCGYDVVRNAHQVRQLVGVTGQYASVDETLTGAENLLLIGRLLGQTRPGAKHRATELLARFRLDDAGHRAVKTYSGGMRRRLDLAASLVGRPRVLYLDEPTTGLDPLSRNEVWDVVRDLVGTGVTVLLTTQYLEEADQLADDIAVVDHGRVISTGTPSELKARVGGQTLMVRPADPVDLPTILSIVERLAITEPEVRSGTVTAPVADAAVLPSVVRRLDEAGVAIAELSLRGASLDEVFLTLTGHRAETETETEATASTRDATSHARNGDPARHHPATVATDSIAAAFPRWYATSKASSPSASREPASTRSWSTKVRSMVPRIAMLEPSHSAALAASPSRRQTSARPTSTWAMTGASIELRATRTASSCRALAPRRSPSSACR
jgi:oleandomycin transport system ATP-binding protein